MGGEISQMIADADNRTLIEEIIQYEGSNAKAKAKLVENARAADNLARKFKAEYGNGISVMGVIVNTSGDCIVRLKNWARKSGKDWCDSKTHLPNASIKPCAATAFFHAKRDGTMCSSNAAFVLVVKNRAETKSLTFTLAWENPYAGKPALYIQPGEDMEAGMDWCDKNSGRNIHKHFNEQCMKITGEFDDKSTLTLCASLICKEMLKKTDIVEGFDDLPPVPATTAKQEQERKAATTPAAAASSAAAATTPAAAASSAAAATTPAAAKAMEVGTFRYSAAKRSCRALIFSIHKGRAGAQTELDNAYTVLSQLGCIVETVVDPTADTFKARLREFRDRADWSEYGSSMVCIMAHGSMDTGTLEVEAADTCTPPHLLDIRELFAILTPGNCPGLAGKPKMWIIQACRNGGTPLVLDDVGGGPKKPKLTNARDFLWTYAAMPGSAAIRGVFFRQLYAFVNSPKIGSDRAKKMTWADLFAQTNHRMAVEGIGSSIMDSTLRSMMMSPASLQM